MTMHNEHFAGKIIDYLIALNVIDIDKLDHPEQYLTTVFNDIVNILEG